MSEARLKQELAESKAELGRLREEMSSGMHTVHKDLSLICLIPKCSGAENTTPLEEFFRKHCQISINRQWARS